MQLDYLPAGGNPVASNDKESMCRESLVPGSGGRVMKVKVESQRKPDINVGEKHLASWARQLATLSVDPEGPGNWQDPLVAESLQCAYWSGAGFPDVWNEPGETKRASFFQTCTKSEPYRT